MAKTYRPLTAAERSERHRAALKRYYEANKGRFKRYYQDHKAERDAYTRDYRERARDKR